MRRRDRGRTRRSWKPNVHTKRIWSDAFGTMLKLRVTTHALRCIDREVTTVFSLLSCRWSLLAFFFLTPHAHSPHSPLPFSPIHPTLFLRLLSGLFVLLSIIFFTSLVIVVFLCPTSFPVIQSFSRFLPSSFPHSPSGPCLSLFIFDSCSLSRSVCRFAL
jgi:ribosomal protein L28